MAAKKTVRNASRYEKDIATQRQKLALNKQRLEKAENKEVRRWIKLAKSMDLLDYPLTDDDLKEAFSELAVKKQQANVNP